jgi:hypothetical protein
MWEEEGAARWGGPWGQVAFVLVYGDDDNKELLGQRERERASMVGCGLRERKREMTGPLGGVGRG